MNASMGPARGTSLIRRGHGYDNDASLVFWTLMGVPFVKMKRFGLRSVRDMMRSLGGSGWPRRKWLPSLDKLLAGPPARGRFFFFLTSCW
jgi:hypothetical protein